MYGRFYERDTLITKHDMAIQIVSDMDTEQLVEIYERLCEYVRTGLAPEQIENQKHNLAVAYRVFSDKEREWIRNTLSVYSDAQLKEELWRRKREWK